MGDGHYSTDICVVAPFHVQI